MRRPKAHREAPSTLDGRGVPPPAPQCPPGWRTGPPDFIGVGAQRCGTTSMYKTLCQHPAVLPAVMHKGTHYFDRFHNGGYAAADTQRYHEYL